ncbi:uncharacterized protein LOC114758344 [Neltuma alba]|uniref:uncharacterized protein LOC114758344 n=1 Tax=Neltuma alba TaxID=207710 RepID=UPI0010A4E1C3|nr:uncharacterized protein LOC114758344 [Prosopis alba]
MEDELKLHVSIYKCKLEKKIIMRQMEGSYIDEFNNLQAYCHELKTSNPGSDVSLELSKDALDNGKRMFNRLYICFNALKGNANGIILTATGLDVDDFLYPIAFGITQKENTVNWKWFFQWLQKSLDLNNGERVTIMSDMQKGLHLAVSDVLPEAEHRLCARHIYANWSKRWHSGQLKKTFFACAWSTFEEQFDDNLRALGALSKEAEQAVVSYPPPIYLPIIRMIDGIRIKMMSKWAESERLAEKWKGNFSPKSIALFEENRNLFVHCRVAFNGDDGYEVNEGDNRHTVFINRKQRTCRAWDLTVRGKAFWGIHRFQSLEPPLVSNMPGRPRKKRIRTEESARRRKIGNPGQPAQKSSQQNPDLPLPTPDKLSKRRSTAKCTICQKEGHNRATCPDKPQSSLKTPRPKRLRRSQSKAPTQESQATSRPRGGGAFYKNRTESGMGLRVDLDSGQCG